MDLKMGQERAASAASLIHLSGVPAAGKSYFGRWLEANKGFIHIDAENDGRLKTYGLESSWAQCFSGGEVIAFRDSLVAIGKPVVLDWGFPVACLPVVEQLRDVGIGIWWFDGRHDVARRAFRERGTGSVSAFDRQVAAIRQSWTGIEKVFGENIIKTLLDNGNHLDSPTIHNLITT